MIKVKKTSNDANVNDLEINFKRLNRFPLFYLPEKFVNDTLIEEEDTIDTNFGNELYDTVLKDRFSNILNIETLFYVCKVRLIWDKEKSNYFITTDLDYIPLLNTANKSTILFNVEIAGKKNIRKNVSDNGTYEQINFSVVNGEENDVVIPDPDTDNISTDDFKLYRLDLPGIENSIKTNWLNANTRIGETNEIYMLRMDKKKLFGSDTKLHLHKIVPRMLNKNTVEYLGRIADVDYVYLPIQF